MGKALIRSFRYILLKSKTSSALPVLSLSISLWYIVRIGPFLQRHVFEFLDGGNRITYSSMLDESVSEFPSISEWLSPFALTDYLFIAIIISIYATGNFGLKRFAIRIALASAVSLSFMDIFIYTQPIDIAFQSVVSDIVGSIIISFAILLICISAEAIYCQLSGSSSVRKIIAGVSGIGLSILTSTLIYYAAVVFWKPEVVILDVVLSDPSSGTLVNSHVSRRPTAYSGIEPFRLISDDATGGTASWNAPDGVLRAQWKAPSDSAKYDVTITLYSSCETFPGVSEQGPKGIKYTLKDLRSLDLWFDRGQTFFSTLQNAGSRGAFGIYDDPANIFWINRDEDRESVEIQQYVSSQAVMKYRSRHDPISFYISSFPLKSDNKKIALSDRVLHLVSDDHERKLIFQPDPNLLRESCQSKPISDINIYDDTNIVSASVMVGIFVEIATTPNDPSQFIDSDNVVSVSGSPGWIKISNMPKDKLSDAKPGYIGAIEFQGNAENISINGQEISTKPTSEYSSYGDFVARFENTGYLKISGTADDIWRDGSRISKTKWNNLSTEIRLAFLSGASAILVFLLNFIRIRIVKNNSLSWMRFRQNR